MTITKSFCVANGKQNKTKNSKQPIFFVLLFVVDWNIFNRYCPKKTKITYSENVHTKTKTSRKSTITATCSDSMRTCHKHVHTCRSIAFPRILSLLHIYILTYGGKKTSIEKLNVCSNTKSTYAQTLIWAKIKFYYFQRKCNLPVNVTIRIR